jgi:hypothetical protein
MTRLTVTARGQVTFRKDVLHHRHQAGRQDRIGQAAGRTDRSPRREAGGDDRRLHRSAGGQDEQGGHARGDRRRGGGRLGGKSVKITADTNVLIRAVVRDDAEQAAVAARLLREAEVVAVPLPCLCEFA